MSSESILKNQKKKLTDLDQNPFQQREFTRKNDIQTIIKLFSHFSKEELSKKKQKVNIAGRIINRIRVFGKLIFADLADQNGIIQLKITQNENFSKVGRGDIIELTGIVCKTDIQDKQKEKQELSIELENFSILTKCQKSLPDTIHFKFKDVEERFRKRYLDLLVNAENRQILVKRHEVIKAIRKFLDQREFIEIETPILVSEASGAQAKPFITHHNKLHRDFYLRIATEISLKKLLVGGFEKIYEIGRIFRNEGIDARHNPEFTTIEVYQAYENSEYMMDLTEELLHYLAKEVLKKEEFEFNSYSISLKENFRKISMIEAIKEYANVDFSQISNLEEVLGLARKHNLRLEKFQKSIGQVILAFFEEFVEKKLIQPTFIYDYPIEVSPLAKSKAENKDIADRFELYVGGLEFANGYSELNDPIEQKKRFEEQTKQKELGNEEIASFDKEFLEALEYGMPPAGGLGIGIDRLIMLFTGQNRKTEKETSKLKLVEKHDKKYPTEYPFLRKSLDALCWYPEGNSFIIFEYKSELKPRLASGQVIEYLGEFTEEDGKVCKRLLNDLNKLFPKNKGIKWENEEIEITKTKGFSVYFSNTKENAFLAEFSKKYELREESSVFVLTVTDENTFKKGISLLKEFLKLISEPEKYIKNKNQLIITYCNYGNRSGQAAQTLREKGYLNVFVLKEGVEVDLAQKLLGKILVRNINGQLIKVKIVETEAYDGKIDRACHAHQENSRGGFAYVYLIYGMYYCFNITSSFKGDPQAVLIRAAEPLNHHTIPVSSQHDPKKKYHYYTNGPGKLCRALNIDISLNNVDLTTSDLIYLEDQPEIKVENNFSTSGCWEITVPSLLSAETLGKLLYSIYNKLNYLFDFLDFQIRFKEPNLVINEDTIKEYFSLICTTPFLQKEKESKKNLNTSSSQQNSLKGNQSEKPKLEKNNYDLARFNGVHTKFSTLDGISSPNDYVESAKKKDYAALAITDHYNVQSFPEFSKHQSNDLKIIYGCELEVLADKLPPYIFNHNDSILTAEIENLTYCIFDLETTGFFSTYNEIIEIGIDPNELKSAPKIKEVLPLLKKDWENCVLVAHNAANFDYGFLNKSYSLERLTRIPGREKVVQTHRALGDREVEKLIDGKYFPNRGHKVKVLVINQEGLNNLYRLVTLSHTERLFKKPCVFHSDLVKYRQGLLVGASGGREGEMFTLFSSFNSIQKRKKRMKFYDYIEAGSPNSLRHL
ncbi:18440_t:CDS:10 [Funneliformis geosporum]|uniref:Lysine--tRNA ligase n=1 Tax=Funneliformis geosporum TaxID=1117311 RepID=A0A9W4SHY2_9GLOM|nr:18440_t:CDS:10 [Funneliformis geosporum]